MTVVLAGLVVRMLVGGGRDPAHARVRPAELTTTGKRVLARANGAVDDVERAMLRGVTAAERRRLAQLLAASLRGLE
jgi:DNA-binding MarR family transcriptional regulator